jgi:hypothetical protein
MSTVRIQVRRGTASDWTTANPTLAAGEVGFDTTSNKMKVGDGSTTWSTLPYISSDAPGVGEIAQDAIFTALTLGNGLEKSYDDTLNKINLSNTGVLSFNTRSGSVTLTSTDVNTALGYTAANAEDITSLAGQTGTDISAALIAAEDYADTLVDSLTTTDIEEGTNLYFTNERAQDAIGANVGVGISYNDTTGAISNSGVTYLSVNEQQLKTDAHNGNVTLGLSDSVVITDHLGVGGNLIVDGNIQINGSTTTVNSTTVSVKDNLIYLNQPTYATITGAAKTSNTVTYTVNDIGSIQVGNTVVITGANPSAYNVSLADAKTVTAVSGNTFTVSKTVSPAYTSGGHVDAYSSAQPDLGLVGGYESTDNTHRHAGIFRDASTGGTWTFFNNLSDEPGVTIDTSAASFELAPVKAGSVTADTLTSNGSVYATDFLGDLTGSVTGPVTGNTYGTHVGNVTGNVTGEITGNVTGDLTGNVTGDLTGDSNGTHVGPVTGAVTGNVTGDVSGNAGSAEKVNRKLTIGTNLTGTEFDGSTAVTIGLGTNVALVNGTQTLSNKTISGANNTLQNVPNSALSNSSITLGSTAVNLGDTKTSISGLTLTSATIDGATSTLSNIANGSLANSTITLGTTAINLGETKTTLAGLSLSGSTNTFTSIPNSALTNSSISVNGSSVSLGGSVSGLATNASPTFTGTVTLPLSTGGYVTTNSSGVISSVATIPNAGLTNSAITINGTSVSLGGTRTLGTDDVSEGTTNKYFTDERAQDAVGGILGSGLTYSDVANTITVDSSVIQLRVAGVADTEIGYLDGVTSAIQTQINAKAPIDSPTFTGTVSGVTKSMVGLGSVDNTADTAKPVSTAQQTALNLKANIASPEFTGVPTAPTAAATTNTTQVATTAYVRGEIAALVNSAGSTLDTLGEIATALGNDANLSTTLTTSIGLKAPINSPTFTGTVTLPTGTVTSGMILDGTIVDADINASAAIAQSKISGLSTALDAKLASATAATTYAPIASPTFTGTVTIPTGASITSPTMSGTVTYASGGKIQFSDGTQQSTAGVASITTIGTAVAANNTTYYPSLQRDYMVPISGTYTLTIAPDGTNTAAIGTSVDFYQSSGTGGAFAAGAGVTILSTPGLKLRTTGSVATIMKTAANTWLLFGDLSA